MNRQFLRFLIRVLPTLLVFVPTFAFAASLNLSPSTVSVAAGDTFVERVLATSATQAANAVSGTLSFPTDLFSVVSVSKANSVLTLWVQDPSFSNSDGTVDFSGVVPNPGFTGSGTVFSVTFVAKKAAQGTISFLASAILANDGNGTDILSSTNPSNVTVTNAPVPPPTPTPASIVAPAPAHVSPIKLMPPYRTSTSTSAGVVAPWFVLNVPTLLLACALVLMLLWILFLLRHHGPRGAGRRRGHAHMLVHQEFGGLRAAVTSEVLKLEHTRTKRELNKQEELFIDRMQKMLNKAEEVIEKEIEE